MDYRQLAYQTAQKYGIDPDLFVRQIQAESAFRPDAVSPAGAIGLGQLMPATARELGVDPRDPVQNLEGAARYMKQQLDAFKDPALALAAYNAGPRRVREAGGIPNITETQNYVSKILGSGNTAMVTDQNMNAGTTAEQAAAQAAAASAAMQEQSTSDKYKDIAGNLAVAFNSMRLNPDPALASTIKDIRTARTEKQAKNKTLAYLEEIGRKDLVNAIGAGLSPREAIAQMFSEAAELRGFNRQKELIDYKAGLEQPKTYEYQQLAKDLLSQGIAKTEQEALQMALSQKKPAAPSVQVSYGDKGGPPKAFEKVDDEFAKTYVKWGSGGAADAVKNLNQIKGVIKDINLAAKEGRTTSGPLVGIQNDVVQSFLNPEATDIRNRVQEVVQRNLREILGAQFTQNEAAQLIDRAYNQRLSPEMNLRRLNALLDQMSQAATATQQMYDHFKTKGTLFGYEGGGTLPTKEDLHGLMDYFDAQQGVDTSDLRKGAPSKSSTISQADALVGIE